MSISNHMDKKEPGSLRAFWKIGKYGILIWIIPIVINVSAEWLSQQGAELRPIMGWLSLMIDLMAIRIFSKALLSESEESVRMLGKRIGWIFLGIVAVLDMLFFGILSKQGLQYLVAGQPMITLLYLACFLIPWLGGIVEDRYPG